MASAGVLLPLCRDEWERDYFVRMNNTGGTADVWEVSGVDVGELVESPEGYLYVPRPVPRAQLRLLTTDLLSA